jgi:hypothetical protein
VATGHCSENKEVLVAFRSSRPRLRVSRWLLIVLTLLIAAGVLIYLRERKGQREQAKLAAASDPSLKVAALLDPKASPSLTGGPRAGNAGTSPGTKLPAPANTPDPKTQKNPGAAQLQVQPPAKAVPLAVTLKPAGASGKLVADAKAKSDAGDLLGARAILNEPLVSNQLVEADAEPVRHALSDLNQKLVFSAKIYPNDPFEEQTALESGQNLQKLANKYDVTWPLLCRVNGYDPSDAGAKRIRAGRPLKAIKGPFSAVVTKGAFRLDLYLGGLPGEANSTYVTSYPVGLGRDDSTPAGLWTVERKQLKPTYFSPRGEGVIGPNDPKNPLGGYWIGLKGEDGGAIGKTSYGIHGTIEPDSIGKQASMGCIRLRHDDIEMVYETLIVPKSKVLIQP